MPELYVGLMSGTSLDGIDAVLTDLDGASPRLSHAYYQPYSPQLRDALLSLNDEDGRGEIKRAAQCANQLSHAYAAAVRTLLSQARAAAGSVAAIGCHGQTVRHDPQAGYTVQLVNGALLAELTGATVVCDFRSRDVAAGGEGAPLVPAFHYALFHHPGAHRVVVNIGGIANITDLPRTGSVTGFDCGPGNVLLDAWIMEHRGRAYDEDGAWAREGRVDPTLLARLLAHDFFSRRPPKSTGRDVFNLAWLRRMLGGTERLVDVQATLLELTAQAIARAIAGNCAGTGEVFLCGGGARNGALVRRLGELLPDIAVAPTDALGLDAEWVEAFAFAWLAQRALRREPGNLPAVTGAKGPRVLGAIYPA